MNFGFIIDNRKCIGCHACTVACKAEHDVPIGVNRTWVKYIEKGFFPNTRRLFSVMRCNHCADAPCVEICPVTALFVRADGIVDFDNRRCIGCKACTQACPYDALYMDPQSNTAAKCNYCAHRVDVGLEPACVNVCPEHAIISGDMDNPLTEISQLLAREQVTVRKVEKGTQPKLFYIEGDEASLNPTATEPSENYLWSAQARGVGHFAKYAQTKIASTNPTEMTENLAGSSRVGSASPEPVVTHPVGLSSPSDPEKTSREKPRRTYDAPNKGTLWRWQVSAYVWTKAISVGAFLVPFIAWLLDIPVAETHEWIGIGAAMLFLILTGGLLVMDLDQPRRFAYVLLRPQWRSWLVRGGYAIFFFGFIISCLALTKVLGLTALEKTCWWLGAVLAIITAVYTAFLFAQAKGRDFWQSPALAIHMLVHALAAGAAIFALLPNSGSPEWQGLIAKLLAIGIVVNALVIAVELLTPHATGDSQKTVKLITKGAFKNLFWFGAIVLGNVTPLALIFFTSGNLMILAGACVLIGIYITEHIWVQAPQWIPLS